MTPSSALAPGTDAERAARRRLALRSIAALDLTELDPTAGPERILALCRAALTEHGPVAAVCLPPEHVALARATLSTTGAAMVRLATVVNFPEGGADPEAAAAETVRAVDDGADEIDAVFPWRALIAGNERIGRRLIDACKAACDGRARLKVILETGALHSHALIRRAAEIALCAGADFLKTSTGRGPSGASPEAAAVLLETIAEHGGKVGLKISGGVRTLSQAAVYFDLVDRRMGPNWADDPGHFRIGASRLLDEALTMLDDVAAARR